ncbi:carbonyl reductase [Pleomassaria siparia CBS 279.74]|uniref:Carbonyl reductase n=1 Tax=Pleomassaria siparia CBS 279.74 TaxID=1314801 RepID=A0A6G1KHP3_9PLEO|nr:carbonyl reductase [Pleomassaria siparia CBS 279.74]
MAPLVLITGGNAGIGLATAKILAKEHSHQVIIGSRNKEAGEKAAAEVGHGAISVQLDLDSPSSIDAAIATIEKNFGYLDILINNAGAFYDNIPDVPRYELYLKAFKSNVIGPATLTDGLIPLLRKAKSGPPKVIFVSSIMGSIEKSRNPEVPWYNIEARGYKSSKAAVNMLMTDYDRILRDTGAKVNALCPGYVATKINDHNAAGVSAEVGAKRTVELAIDGKDGVTGTYTNIEGTIPF